VRFTRAPAARANPLFLRHLSTPPKNRWHEGLYAPQFTPTYRGFNRSNGFLSGGEDHYTLAGDLGTGACVPGKVATRDAFIENKTAPEVVGEYTGTRFLNAAVDYINGHDAAAPLFLYLALHNTHGPIEAEPADIALYNKTFPWKLQHTYYAMTTAVDRTVGVRGAAPPARKAAAALRPRNEPPPNPSNPARPLRPR